MNPYIVPKMICKKICLEWKLEYLEDFQEAVTPREIVRVIEPIIFKGSWREDLQTIVTLSSVPFMISYFKDERKVFLNSLKLNYELFLLEQNKDQGDEDFRQKIEKIITLNPKRSMSPIELSTELYSLEDFKNDSKWIEIQKESILLENELVIRLKNKRISIFEKLTNKVLQYTVEYDVIRIHFLKFVTIFSSLEQNNFTLEIKKRFLESIERLLNDSKKNTVKTLPSAMIIFFQFIKIFTVLLPSFLLAVIIKKTIQIFAKRFIGGQNIQDAKKCFDRIFKSNRDLTIDQLGEQVFSEVEAEEYMQKILKFIRGFSEYIIKGEKNRSGILKAHVSIKISALCSDFNPQAFESTYNIIQVRLKKIFIAALEEKVFINIDAEQYRYRDLAFQIYSKVLLETVELAEFSDTGIVLQTYLRDTALHFEAILALAKKRQLRMPIRLVKGAYWDIETIEADAKGELAVEFLNKEETDLSFRQHSCKILSSFPHLQLCLASHNFTDHCFVEILRKKSFPETPQIEHQCLHMTYETLSRTMADMGFVVRDYIPIGNLLVGMAYLVRRIMENSSQVGILTMMHSHEQIRDMTPPWDILRKSKREQTFIRDPLIVDKSSNFINIPPLRTYIESERLWVDEALSHVKNNIEINYTHCHGEVREIVNARDPQIKLGSIVFAKESDVKAIISKTDDAYNIGSWASQNHFLRQAVLLKAVNFFLVERCALAASIVYESGKTIEEALLEVDEGIDHIHYYVKNSSHILGDYRGIPRGPFAVITPWNFSLAIPCGMISAALVMGNPVIVKSAEATPLIMDRIINIFYRAGVPENVLIHLPGWGRTIGAALVASPLIAGIVFTGSKKVGLQIQRTVGGRLYYNKKLERRYPVKISTEMGGKNALIVSANAELDETLLGILTSAFGYSGQKCASLSKLFVHRTLLPQLLKRLKEAINDLKVGAPDDWSVKINPLISHEMKIKTLREIESIIAEKFSCVHKNYSHMERIDHCIGPVLIELPLSKVCDKNSFVQRELFAPILTLFSYERISDVVKAFNSTEYALTGGLFSQSQDEIEYFSKVMSCGNIYINRKITGARVGIEPFGGFKLSGTGPKAGSPNYLHIFQVRTQCDPIGKKGYANDSPNESHFELATPSMRSLHSCILRIDQICSQFFKQYFKNNLSEYQRSLRYHLWLKENLESSLQKKHWNKSIPGQLSYNDHSQICACTLVVLTKENPSLGTLLQVISAMAIGSGVTMVALNESAHMWWSDFLDLFYNAKGLQQEATIYRISEKFYEKIKFLKEIEVIIVDEYPQYIEGEWKKLFRVDESGEEPSHMTRILTPHEDHYEEDFYLLYTQFVRIRTFAVNTIRHSAPMHLDS